MLAYTRDDDAGSLLTGLLHHNFAHNTRVVVIQMADGLVGKKKIERLYESSQHSHALLLSERHQTNLGIQLISDTQTFEPPLYFFDRLPSCQMVLYQHVLQGSELWEQPQFLKKMTDMPTPQFHPAGHTKLFDRKSIKEHATREIIAIAQYIATKSTLTFATVGFNKIEMALLKQSLSVPDVALHGVDALSENLRHHGTKFN